MAERKKRPLQIYLREDQVNTLRVLAKRRGESIASLVRESVDLLLEELPPEEDPLLDLVGLFDSGYGDLGEGHDRYLIESIQEESKDGS